jgi:uncharacterized membrane protein YczE
LSGLFARAAKRFLTREFAARLIMSVVGVTVTGASVGFLKFSDFGTDPYNTFVFGFARATGFGFEFSYSLVVLGFLVIVLFFGRRYIGVTTVLNFFLTGFATQWTLDALTAAFGANLAARIICLPVGLLVLCAAVSALIIADVGLAAYDASALILEKRAPLSYRVCRIITDSLCAVAGFALGATVGVTTVIAAAGMGPIINWCNEHINAPILRALSKGRAPGE